MSGSGRGRNHEMGKRELRERRLQEAADSTTPAARLVELCREELGTGRFQSAVLLAAAANPNLPPEILRYLFFDGPALQAVKNPALPLYLLEDPDFLSRCDWAALRNLLREEDLPHFFLTALLAHREPGLATEAAQHVRLAGEAGAEWKEEARNVLRGAPLHLSPFLLELIELGLVPAEVAARAVGASPAYPVRQVLMTGAARNAAYRPLLELLRKVTGTRDLRGRGAPDAEVDPEPLFWLAGNDGWLRRLAARHPRTPPHLLERLAEVGDPTVLRGVAAHPATPPGVLADLARSRYLRVRLAVGRNPAAEPDLLDCLAEDPEVRVRTAIGRHPATRRERLVKLAGDPEGWVRNAVARNPACPPEALIVLAADTHTWVRAGVAGNPAAVPDLLELLSDDPEWKVRAAVAGNPSAPEAALERLSHSTTPQILAALAGNPRLTPDQLELLATHCESGTVADALVAVHGTSSAILERLAGADDAEVRLAVARRPDLPPELQRRLAGDGAPEVRRAVRRHPRRSAATEAALRGAALRQAGENGLDLCQFLALSHPEQPPEGRQRGADHRDWRCRLAVALNPKAEPELLMRLSRDGNRLVRAAARAQLAGEELPAPWGE